MMSKDEEVHLIDLIPADTLQKIQNSFSKMARMAALTTDENGIPLTEGSNFSDFCMNYCRKSPTGRKRCEKCDRDGALRVLESGKPVWYYCHAGLVDFAAPIMLGDRMIGSFIGGQVLAEEPDYDKMRGIAVELGLDEEGFVEAARHTQIVPMAAIERSTNFIFEFSRVISDMAFKTYETIRLSKLAVSQKSDFLANMSHEIRTPMNAVLGMAEMALREEMTPNAKQYIRQIRSSGKHLLVIINDILDFSKIESGKMNIVKVDYEPLSLVNDLVNIVNTRIGSKKLEFTIDFEPSLPQKLYGDNVRIHQILLNVLNNAVKFTEHGEVHLSISHEVIDSETIMLKAVIRDTGIGIKKSDMEKLFQSFQQVDSKRNRNIEGTGLGLAISKQLLKLMNGTITVESEYEKGSTFRIQLPQKVISRAPSIPVAETGIKAALLVENEYVQAQLCRDLSALHIAYTVLKSGEDVKDIKSGYIIAERALFTEKVQQAVVHSLELKCLVITAFDEPFDLDIPRVKMIRKPTFSMGLYSALGLGEEIPPDDSTEDESFLFTAPEANVLIVDDNPVNLTVAAGIIEPLDMHVDTAGGALEAVEKVKKHSYDIIFMDHMMPEVDGVEATHMIRRIPEYGKVPIIALTANAMGGTREMFLREGMNDFVAKPIEVTEIVSMVRKWLPKEKIVPVAESRIKAPEESGELIIPGLNTKQAISMLGSEKLYLQILRDYYKSVDKRSGIIADALERGDIKAYTIEVHSLKSTSRQIGADSLSELAAKLEKAGSEQDMKFINEKTGKLLTRFRACKELIAPVFPEFSEKPEGATADLSVITECLDGASKALDSGNADEMNEVLRKMSGCRFTPAQSQCYERLSSCVKNGNSELGAAIISIWRQIAAAEGGKRTASTEEILSSLENMQSALEGFDSLLIDEAMEEIDSLAIPDDQRELCTKLKNAVEESDIDACSNIVEEWKNMLDS